MDDDQARNKILENMPPKLAAETLIIMDEIASELKVRAFLGRRSADWAHGQVLAHVGGTMKLGTSVTCPWP